MVKGSKKNPGKELHLGEITQRIADLLSLRSKHLKIDKEELHYLQKRETREKDIIDAVIEFKSVKIIGIRAKTNYSPMYISQVLKKYNMHPIAKKPDGSTYGKLEYMPYVVVIDRQKALDAFDKVPTYNEEYDSLKDIILEDIIRNNSFTAEQVHLNTGLDIDDITLVILYEGMGDIIERRERNPEIDKLIYKGLGLREIAGGNIKKRQKIEGYIKSKGLYSTWQYYRQERLRKQEREKRELVKQQKKIEEKRTGLTTVLQNHMLEKALKEDEILYRVLLIKHGNIQTKYRYAHEFLYKVYEGWYMGFGSHRTAKHAGLKNPRKHVSNIIRLWEYAGLTPPYVKPWNNKISVETIARIHEAFKLGLNSCEAARYAGVHPNTVLSHWRRLPYKQKTNN